MVFSISFGSGAEAKARRGTGQREGMGEDEITKFCQGAMASHRRLLEECAMEIVGGMSPGTRGSGVGLPGLEFGGDFGDAI